MPIHFVQGDIFQSEAEALVNPVNCYGVMGKGLALQFKKKYPRYFDYYHGLCLDGVMHTGRVDVYTGQNRPTIISFPTKNHWKDPSSYDYIEKGLMSLSDAIASTGIKSIAIPMLGCEEGTVDWGIVRTMVVNRLSHHHDCTFYIYGSMV